MSSGKEFQTTDAATGKDGMMELAVVVMTMNEVGDDRADRRCGSADSSKVEQDRAAREKP